MAVETDHKPLESIWKKSIPDASPRFQELLLKRAMYNVEIRYIQGKTNFIANFLRRAKEYRYSQLMQLPTHCSLAQLNWKKYKTTQTKTWIPAEVKEEIGKPRPSIVKTTAGSKLRDQSLFKSEWGRGIGGGENRGPSIFFSRNGGALKVQMKAWRRRFASKNFFPAPPPPPFDLNNDWSLRCNRVQLKPLHKTPLACGGQVVSNQESTLAESHETKPLPVQVSLSELPQAPAQSQVPSNQSNDNNQEWPHHNQATYT